MNIKVLVFIFLASFTINSCSVDKCDVDCNSGPLSLNFELKDKITGENLFATGTFRPSDIQVIDLDKNNSNVPFTFYPEDSGNIIQLGPFGWGTNVANYILKIGERDIFTLHIDAEQKTEDCCSFVQVNSLQIKNAESSQNTENDVYEILVDANGRASIP